jgi:hypothetical protein
LVAPLLGCQTAAADEFFVTHVENMLTREFYVPSASDSRLAAAPSLSAALSISNTVNVERRGGESLFVDGESDSLRLALDQAGGADWRYRFSLPVIHDGGGFLDSAIEGWHRFFGFNPGSRPFFPKDQLHYVYRGVAGVDLEHSGTSIGGLEGAAGWYAADDPGRTLSLWGGVQAPTGSTARLTGDGTWDAALWIHWARRAPFWQFGAEAGVTEPFGDGIFSGHAHHPVAFARTALSRTLGARWALRVQLDGQGRRVADSDLRFLGPSLQLSLGASCRLRGGARVDFGFGEDAAVNTAPDVTFFVSVRR